MDVIESFVGSAFGASVRGSSHVAKDKPNQDSVGWDQERFWTYVAVADGHGGAPHYRSDRGSRFAVAALMEVFREITHEGRLRHGDRVVRDVATYAEQLVSKWRARVEADIADDPLPDPPGFASFKVYGSTCLGAAIGPGLSLMLQLGDGDLVVGVADAIERPFTSDDLVGEQTYSICLPDAAQHVKIGVFTAPHHLSVPDIVMASTDGLGKSFRSEQDLREVVAKTFAALRQRGPVEIAAGLEGWLGECSAMGSGDDTSVAVFYAGGDGRAAAAQATGAPQRAPEVPRPALSRAGSPTQYFKPTVVGFVALITGLILGASLADRMAHLFARRPIPTALPASPADGPSLPSQLPLSPLPPAPAPPSTRPADDASAPPEKSPGAPAQAPRDQPGTSTDEPKAAPAAPAPSK